MPVFGDGVQFWLDLRSQYEIAIVGKERGSEIFERLVVGVA
jgi:plasmid maintenance system antidote protein VapI